MTFPGAEILFDERHDSVKIHVARHAQNGVVGGVVLAVELFQVGASYVVYGRRGGRNFGSRKIPVKHAVEPFACQETGFRAHLLQAGELPLLILGKLILRKRRVQDNVAHQFENAIGVFHQART